MNEEQNKELREKLEVRIVALLLGEASAFETAEIEQAMEKDPELALFHAEMRRTIELTREASRQFHAGSQSAAAQAKLSAERRQALLAKFKEGKVVQVAISQPKRGRRRWLIPASLAAGIIFLLSAISLPHLRGIADRRHAMSPSAQTDVLEGKGEADLSLPAIAPPANLPDSRLTHLREKLVESKEAGWANRFQISGRISAEKSAKVKLPVGGAPVPTEQTPEAVLQAADSRLAAYTVTVTPPPPAAVSHFSVTPARPLNIAGNDLPAPTPSKPPVAGQAGTAPRVYLPPSQTGPESAPAEQDEKSLASVSVESRLLHSGGPVQPTESEAGRPTVRDSEQSAEFDIGGPMTAETANTLLGEKAAKKRSESREKAASIEQSVKEPKPASTGPQAVTKALGFEIAGDVAGNGLGRDVNGGFDLLGEGAKQGGGMGGYGGGGGEARVPGYAGGIGALGGGVFFRVKPDESGGRAKLPETDGDGLRAAKGESAAYNWGMMTTNSLIAANSWGDFGAQAPVSASTGIRYFTGPTDQNSSKVPLLQTSPKTPLFGDQPVVGGLFGNEPADGKGGATVTLNNVENRTSGLDEKTKNTPHDSVAALGTGLAVTPGLPRAQAPSDTTTPVAGLDVSGLSSPSASGSSFQDMVADLDSTPARKQKVFVQNLENADPKQVQQILQTMFQRAATSQNWATLNQNSALNTRSIVSTTSAGKGMGSLEEGSFNLERSGQPISAAVTPPSKVGLTGFTPTFGPPRAMLEIKDQEAGKPATTRKPIMREGQKDGEVELLSIDVEKNLTKIRNAGRETEIGFETPKLGAVVPAAPAAPAGSPPVALGLNQLAGENKDVKDERAPVAASSPAPVAQSGARFSQRLNSIVNRAASGVENIQTLNGKPNTVRSEPALDGFSVAAGTNAAWHFQEPAAQLPPEKPAGGGGVYSVDVVGYINLPDGRVFTNLAPIANEGERSLAHKSYGTAPQPPQGEPTLVREESKSPAITSGAKDLKLGNANVFLPAQDSLTVAAAEPKKLENEGFSQNRFYRTRLADDQAKAVPEKPAEVEKAAEDLPMLGAVKLPADSRLQAGKALLDGAAETDYIAEAKQKVLEWGRQENAIQTHAALFDQSAGLDGARLNREQASTVAEREKQLMKQANPAEVRLDEAKHSAFGLKPPPPPQDAMNMIKLQDADISHVLDAYQELTGRTVVRPNNLPNTKITISDQATLNKKDAIQILDTVLAMNGITMTPQGTKFVKALPEGQAATAGEQFSDPDHPVNETTRVVTKTVQLQNALPREVGPVLQPLAKMSNSIMAIDGTGILVLRDSEENIKQMEELLRKIDVVPANEYDPVVIPIKHAHASDVAQVLSSLTAGGGSATTVGSRPAGTGLSSTTGSQSLSGGIGGIGGAGGLNSPAAGQSAFQDRLRSMVNRAASGTGGDTVVIGQSKIIADERSNALLVFANKGDTGTITNIIAKLEVGLAQNAGQETNLTVQTPVVAASAATPQPEINARENSFSTFSLNVSDVSFKLAAASLENSVMPDPASIRVEEFVNAFNYHDPAPQAGARLAFAWERAHYPFAHNRDILRFAIQTAVRGREPQKPLNLVILLDNSGSMERADRVQIIREAMKVLAQQLQPQDRISVIAFARTARLWVDGMAGGKPKEFLEKVLELNPDGGTNLEDALGLGYATATRHFMANGINRVILLTDGAANLGNVEPEVLKQQVVSNRIKGIALDCFGIGWEGYNDDLLEVLSHNGDGRYGFLNEPEEAGPEFANQLAGALNVEAADVKTQVEFNPRRVLTWRQIGYAKHQLTKQQFRDNTVDAAELGAAESGNALYAIQVNPEGSGPIGVVRVRYKIPATGRYVEQAWTVGYQPKVPALDEASPAMRLAVTAAALGEWLSRSPYAGEVTPAALQRYLNSVCETYAPDSRPQRLAGMLRQAQAIGGK